MLPTSVAKKVIEVTDIVEVVSEYVQLKKKGTSYFGICPFHDDKNPSMSVSGEKKIFNCFSCGTKGNVIYFVAKHENLTYEQATIKLAKRAGIKIDEQVSLKDAKNNRLLNVMNEAYNFYRFYLYSSEEGKIALEYLKNRGIDDEIIKDFKIGLAPKAYDYLHQALNKKDITTLDQIELGLVKDVNGKVHDIFRNRIMFSISNPSGQIVGFSGRIYEKSDQAKYINSIENVLFHKGEVLYNYNLASLEARKRDQIFIFEGFMDVISVKKAGITNCVATMGTAMTKEHVNLLTKLTKKIVLFFDGDEAGFKAMKRSSQMLAERKIIPNAVVLPDGLDPDEYISKFGVDQFNHYVENNMKNVFIVLYELALSKVFLQDFASVENFKKEVYELIRVANSEIITNYFINRLAEDLKIEIDIIKDDFSKSSFSVRNTYNNTNGDDYYNNDYQYDVYPIYDEPAIKPKRKKEVKITPNVIMAYNTVIKFSIYSRELLSVFYEKLSYEGTLRYPGAKLSNQFNLIYLLSEYYAQNEYKDGVGDEMLYELLKDDSSLLEFAKDIVENKFIDAKNQQLFDDSIKVINNYFKKLDNVASYNAALFASDNEEIEKNSQQFIEISKSQKKIVNEEDI